MDWDPGADLTYTAKLEVVRGYLERSGLRTMVETGMWNACGSGMQMQNLLDTYIVLDISPEQCAEARARGFTAVEGDSGYSMPSVLDTLTGPAFFWLDAHLVSEQNEQNYSSVMDELDAILAWPHHRASTILIDDLRMMGREGWPTVEGVRVKVGNVWVREESSDVMRLTPREFRPGVLR
jgi:hypothetical protein